MCALEVGLVGQVAERREECCWRHGVLTLAAFQQSSRCVPHSLVSIRFLGVDVNRNGRDKTPQLGSTESKALKRP